MLRRYDRHFSSIAVNSGYVEASRWDMRARRGSERRSDGVARTPRRVHEIRGSLMAATEVGTQNLGGSAGITTLMTSHIRVMGRA